MNKVKLFLPAIIWAILIMILDFMPANPIKTKEDGGFFIPLDKIIHLVQHLTFVIILFRSFQLMGLTKNQNMAAVLLIAFALGLIIEIIQENFIPNRKFNWYDVLYNVIGSLGILALQRPLSFVVKNKMELSLFKNFYKPAVWMLIILILCMMPSDDVEKMRFPWLPENFDKIVHCGFYMILGVLMMASLLRFLNHPWRSVLLTLTLCILYGIIVEIFQHFYTSTRQFEGIDIVFNSAGTIIGCGLFFLRKNLFLRYF